MAAGLGTRLRPFTDLAPKPLLPVMGVPMAQYGIDAMVSAGVSELVANIHHLPDIAARGLGGLDLQGARLGISDERELLLGSAGGLRKALGLLGDREPFFLVNGDVLCDVDLRKLAARHLALRRQWGVTLTLALFPRGPAGARYREIGIDPLTGMVRQLGNLEEGRPFFVGVAVIEPEALAHLPEGRPLEFVPEILAPAIASGRAGAYMTEGRWHDIGSSALWLGTHLSLLDAMETGAVSPVWRKRIEKASRRSGDRAWVSRGAKGAPTALFGPAYLGDAPTRARQEDAHWPRGLGPGAVLYGPMAGAGELAAGIGYDGLWFPLPAA